MAMIDNIEDWGKSSSHYQITPSHNSVLVGSPLKFDILAAHNKHMKNEDGSLRSIDLVRAQAQWEAMCKEFKKAGLKVSTLKAKEGLPDLCFTANPSFIVPHKKEVWIGKMRHNSRQKETELHKAFFQKQRFRIRELSNSSICFEGHGDGLWHPHRLLLHTGNGERTEKEAWNEISRSYPELDILNYNLCHPDFYHLDTALACLSESTALIVPFAFDKKGLEIIKKAFPNYIELNEEESYNFAGNAFCPDGKHVFIQKGTKRLTKKLTKQGFKVVPIETEQFLLSGGSVFCLKQSYYLEQEQ